MGFWLTPASMGNAEMTLGGIDESKIQGKKIDYIPIYRGAYVCPFIFNILFSRYANRVEGLLATRIGSVRG
jgi:hypothetical protein